MASEQDASSRESSSIRNEITKLTAEKEQKYKEKHAISQQIISLISSIKKIREERNAYTVEVKALKENRLKLNSDLTKMVGEIKEINKEKQDLKRKLGLNEDPSKLKAQIDALNTKVETEVMSFEAEKKLMKAIKDLMKSYTSATQANQVFDKSYEKSQQIHTMKEGADNVHRQVQQKAKESQKKHEEILDHSKQIDELKKSEHTLEEQIVALKQQISALYDKLNEQTPAEQPANSHRETPRKQNRSGSNDRQRSRAGELAIRQKNVQEKLARGDKLTNEDLLVMQTMDDDE